MRTRLFAVIALLALAMAPVRAAERVLTVGALLDLSGPAALLGVPVKNGMEMRFAEANARGELPGITLRLLVEDTGYDPKRAILAARKLTERDGAIAFLSNLGTPVVLATMPEILRRGRLHLFPFSPHEATYAPLHPLKFQIYAPYRSYMDPAVRAVLRRHPQVRRVCTLVQDDEFGEEVSAGVRAGLERAGLSLTQEARHARGATDFTGQIARLREAGCELVTLGTLVRETVALLRTASEMGWKPLFLTSASAYSDQTHALGGAAVEGLYGVTNPIRIPYREGASPELLAWLDAYRARYGTEANVWSAMGYVAAELLVLAIATATEPTPEAIAQALERLDYPGDLFGSPRYRFSPTDHLGQRTGGELTRIEHGRWVSLERLDGPSE
ncbi:ABC transporter substrate-binding protein [Tepidiphilus thermophilus]|uniref:ABC-type branched-chain amino acid transport system, periplasmic component n=1 Tax=Tepidiphilus thermophilus TaxID=876478 RepID=A0A0K6ITT1_9PROT|nr:ABC transporter substrate-binding protein [Tepidiphilus thermophilus]CUB06510.1 ABC-type branched-chain amino acid transport system, periplasmic component [Tepidiphilus thermophilus]